MPFAIALNYCSNVWKKRQNIEYLTSFAPLILLMKKQEILHGAMRVGLGQMTREMTYLTQLETRGETTYFCEQK